MPEKKKERRPSSTGGSRPTAGAGARGGRVTPKGGHRSAKGATPPPSGRYTPPIPAKYKVSSQWVPIAMGIFLIGGMLTIICNYLNLLPGPEPSNAYLLGGLGLITLGFIVATRWR